jgi:hypothetical protein
MILHFCFSVNLVPYKTHTKFKTKGRHIKVMHTSCGNHAMTATPTDMWAKLNIYTTKYSSSSSSTSTSTTNYSSERHESASRPPSGFWCLNDKITKELMSFAMCETRKCLVIILSLFTLQYICNG